MKKLLSLCLIIGTLFSINHNQSFAAANSLCESSVSGIEIDPEEELNCSQTTVNLGFWVETNCPGWFTTIISKVQQDETLLEIESREHQVQLVESQIQFAVENIQGGIYQMDIFDPLDNFIESKRFPVNVTGIIYEVVVTTPDSCSTDTGRFTVFGDFPAGTTFTWYGIGTFSEPEIDGLSAGTYSLMVDDGGCREYHIDEMTDSEGAAFFIGQGAASCDSGGSFLLYFEAGTPPFLCELYDDNGNIVDQLESDDFSNQTFEGLASGNYVVKVMDASGCEATEEESIQCGCGPSYIDFNHIEDEGCGHLVGTISDFGCFGDSVLIQITGPAGYLVESVSVNDGSSINFNLDATVQGGDYVLFVENLNSGNTTSASIDEYKGCCDDVVVNAAVIGDPSTLDCLWVEYTVNTCLPFTEILISLRDYTETDVAAYEISAITDSQGRASGVFTPWGVDGSTVYILRATLPDGDSDSDAIIYPDCTLTDTEEVTGEDIVIYPNPVKDILYIDLDPGDFSTNLMYRIVSTDGKQLQSGEFISQDMQIDISKLSAGVYLCQIINDGVYKSRKFVVAK